MLASCIRCPLAQAKCKRCLEIHVLGENWLFTEDAPEKFILKFLKYTHILTGIIKWSIFGVSQDQTQLCVNIHVANNSDYEYTPI